MADKSVFSDYNYILFNISVQKEAKKPHRNFKRTNWDRFGSVLVNKLSVVRKHDVSSASVLESGVVKFQRELNTAFFIYMSN